MFDFGAEVKSALETEVKLEPKINVENLDVLIYELKRVPKRFNMLRWFEIVDNECGTACCIGGTAALIIAREGSCCSHPDGINRRMVASWLGISHRTAANLFYLTDDEQLRSPTYGYLDSVKLPHALAMLERLRIKGSVGLEDWKEVCPEAIMPEYWDC